MEFIHITEVVMRFINKIIIIIIITVIIIIIYKIKFYLTSKCIQNLQQIIITI